MKTTKGASFYFHHGWHFLLADVFPLADALTKWQDEEGHFFYEVDYQEKNWQEVVVPHTFNDVDLFKKRIQDAGSGQKRTTSFYRNWLTIPQEHAGQKVLLEFEGIRQTCYLYVNGQMVGYYEAGVAPIGFDISSYVVPDKPNLIAIATDNTTTRNIPLCIAETPNKEDAIPGSYLLSQEQKAPKNREGVPFFWNCNDFNPSVGGLSKPIKVHFKPQTYLTLPLYSNLQTKGCYVYTATIDTANKTVTLGVTAEVRNENEAAVAAHLQVTVKTLTGEVVTQFTTETVQLPSGKKIVPPLSITPQDAYVWSPEKDGYVAVEDETKVAPTETKSLAVTTLSGASAAFTARLWQLNDPYLYRVTIALVVNDEIIDEEVVETGFRKVGYDAKRGVLINDVPVWLRGYAQRATNEWAAIGIPTEWLRDVDAKLIRESNANHIRFMHVAGSLGDVRAYDRHGVICTQPAGDKERENFGRQWDQRVELMRDIIIAFRNQPSILFWEAGNNSISKEHMQEMRLLKEKLDPDGGRFMGCRTLNTVEVVNESEYVGTMLNRHAAKFTAEHGPIMETEYSREEAPRRIWDDFTPPDFDYRNKWVGKGGKKQVGTDFHDLTSEDLALANARGYQEFFNNRTGGASHHDFYSGCAALCWTDSAQHGRQAFSENGRMSGRVDPVRVKKQSFDYYRVMQGEEPAVKIVGHWNYPALTKDSYLYPVKEFNGEYYAETGEFAQRDPKHKTVYVMASYPVKRVELLVNDVLVGSSTTPQDTFVYAFPKVDITQNGTVKALAYDFNDALVAEDVLTTTGKPARLQVTPHVGPQGWLADGNDIAYFDIAVLDEKGRVCPLADARIDFTTKGTAEFLGGYNSGRFSDFGTKESVIHENYVYAECGTNRVFMRASQLSEIVELTASMAGVPSATVTLTTQEAPCTPLTQDALPVYYYDYEASAPCATPEFPALLAADALKYTAPAANFSKILINGQEPDSRGVPTVNENGRIWGNVLVILERLKPAMNNSFTFDWLPAAKKLTVYSAGHTIEAEVGRTHLLVDGEENLMDGEPYVTPEGQLVMEVNAIVPFIMGTTVQYDDQINVLRIVTEN
ncbi:sugar-binding domain-containing protein [Enterococcus nangangensis]|uniref:sugar-binding domain-containing protein n=1 Tax=Enterococcus nangangensis TaxID=2559926 RepID=UPI0010F9200D|nr:sugar-binding domain-containing protein [Enterococcus nangangensis]